MTRPILLLLALVSALSRAAITKVLDDDSWKPRFTDKDRTPYSGGRREELTSCDKAKNAKECLASDVPALEGCTWIGKFSKADPGRCMLQSEVDCDTDGLEKLDCFAIPNKKCAYLYRKCDFYNPSAPTPQTTQPPKKPKGNKGQGRKNRSFSGDCRDYDESSRDCKVRRKFRCWYNNKTCYNLDDVPCDTDGLPMQLCKRHKKCRVNPDDKSCYAADKPPVKEGECEGTPKELCRNPQSLAKGCVWLDDECLTVKTLADCSKTTSMRWCNLWGKTGKRDNPNVEGAQNIGCKWMMGKCLDPSTVTCDSDLSGNECRLMPQAMGCKWFRNECYSPKRMNETWDRCTRADNNNCDRQYCQWDPDAKAPWRQTGKGSCVEAKEVAGRTCAYYTNRDGCQQDWQAKYRLKCRWMEKKRPKCQPPANQG